MRKSRFSEEQIIAILKESEAGVETGELCRRHGIAKACFYRWKSKYGGLELSEAQTAEAVGGGEPAAEAHRGRAGGGHPGVEGGSRKKVVSPQARREAVLVMQVEVELSQRRACGLMDLYRATCRYRQRRSEDQSLRARLRELAEARRRFGYRRLQILLAAGRLAGKPQAGVPAVRGGEAVAAAQARAETQHGAPAAAGSRGRQPGVVGRLHERCAQFGTEVSHLEHRG